MPPTIFVSARGQTADKVRAFKLGAEDYLVKPFDLEELLARLRALLRRTAAGRGEGPAEGPLVFADLTLDLGTREVRRGERDIRLTRTEFSLLELLMSHPRQVLTRERILEQVWGYDFPTTANSLEVYVGYLRRKTEAEGEPRLLHTVRGVGYVLRETPP
jgi:two-component system response regulator MprA